MAEEPRAHRSLLRTVIRRQGHHTGFPRFVIPTRDRQAWTAKFSDGGSYITLRGHTSGLRGDGREPVRWHVGTADTDRFRVAMRLNYRLQSRRGSNR